MRTRNCETAYSSLLFHCRLGPSLYRPIYHRIASANQKAARNWRAKYQPISVQRGIRAQSISQSEGCQERARTPTNQSASNNRANADQSERLQERAAQGLEHLQNEGHNY